MLYFTSPGLFCYHQYLLHHADFCTRSHTQQDLGHTKEVGKKKVPALSILLIAVWLNPQQCEHIKTKWNNKRLVFQNVKEKLEGEGGLAEILMKIHFNIRKQKSYALCFILRRASPSEFTLLTPQMVLLWTHMASEKAVITTHFTFLDQIHENIYIINPSVMGYTHGVFFWCQ